MSAVLMREEQAGAVAALERLCFDAPWSEAALCRLVREGGFAVLCEEGGQVVAYGGMLCVLDEGQVTNIATHPDYRRRGYGEAVLLEMIGEAKRRGIASLSLEVRASNAAAIALYEKHGFLAAGTRRGFYTHPREDALVMIKEL